MVIRPINGLFMSADQAAHHLGWLTTAIEAGEQLVATSKSQVSNGSLHHVVGQANPPIVEEAAKDDQQVSM